MKIPNVSSYATQFKIGLYVFLALLLTGCGGGGGGSSGTVTSSQIFPLQSAMKDSVTKGGYTNFAITGTCNGTASIVTLIPTAASFEGVSGVSATSTTTLSFSNCFPSYDQSISTDFYDANFVPLGSVVTGGDYGVFLTPPDISASVKVGDKGTIGTMKNYSDSTKAVSTGQDVYSYVIEPDTANTAIVNIIIKIYDAAGILTATEQDRYRITTAGTLTQISSDLQFSNGSTTHLIFTLIPDTLAPTVLSTNPASNSVAASKGTSVTATFSEPLDASTVTASTFTVMDVAGGSVAGTVSYSGTTATFVPAAALTFSTPYRATITTGVKDLAGNVMSSNYSWSFTPDLIPPTVLSTTPVNSAIDIALNTPVTVTFNEPMDPATVTSAEFTLMNGATPVAGAVTYSGTIATFTPATPLTPNILYTATITTGVKDLAGNQLPSKYSWVFSTDVLFMNYVSTATGSPPEAVAIGDVNGDGKNDVVITTSSGGGTSSDNKVFVFLQNATGGLNTPVIYAISGTTSPLTVAIGDMNHDGKNDVVVGYSYCGIPGCGIEVFIQNNSGGLNSGVVYESSDSNKIRIADLNNDGWMDVVGIGGGTSASVWLQNAGGTLNAAVTYNVTSGGDLEVGDINNDGLTDIIVMSGQNIGVLTQTVGGTLNAPAYYSVGADIYAVAVGDINGDTLNDIVVTYGGNQPSSKIGVFTQNVSQTLDPMVNYDSYDMPGPVEIADVTGDGREDIIVLHNGWMAMGVYHQLIDGTLQTEKLYTVPYASWYNAQALAVGDINGDGKNDAVVVDIGGGLSVLYHF